MTIWFIILFLESPLVQLLEAESADKMFRMELAKHGCDTATCKRKIKLRYVENNYGCNGRSLI
jgi:hypothetical protein